MEQEFWTNIICCFKQEGCLQEESFNRLSEFMTQENFGFLFEGEVPENYDYEACKNKLANDFVTLKRQYEERNLSLSRFPEEMLALKAKYAVNEDFYIKQNFTKAEIYIEKRRCRVSYMLQSSREKHVKSRLTKKVWHVKL